MTSAPELLPDPEPDEPRDVRVWKAMGWYCPLDAEFILRMIAANGLSVYRSVVGDWLTWFAVNDEDTAGEGKTPAEAVISWILAADAAGVKIRTEVPHD